MPRDSWEKARDPEMSQINEIRPSKHIGQTWNMTFQKVLFIWNEQASTFFNAQFVEEWIMAGICLTT